MRPSKHTASRKDPEIVIFDLDGTLTESKAPLSPRMSRVIASLLRHKKVAIIGGGRYLQFKKQFVSRLACPPSLLRNLFLFPTNATAFYRFEGRSWKKIYSRELSSKEKKDIIRAFHHAFQAIGYVMPAKIWGKTIEDRETEITFSALGQKAPLSAKKAWNRRHDVRLRIMAALRPELPRFEIREGGETSIDVTRKGIDKAYGVRVIARYMRTPVSRMVFMGDELQGGGNDAAAKKTGIHCIPVKSPRDTERAIAVILRAGESTKSL